MGGNTFRDRKLTQGWKCCGCEDPNQPAPRIWHADCYMKYVHENEIVLEEEIGENNPEMSDD